MLYITGTRTGVLESDVNWKYHTLWLRNWKVLLKESIENFDGDVEKNCKHCMTLRYVPSRDDNRLIGQSTVICNGQQI